MATLVINATRFFHRESYMYSFGDIKFKNPVPLNRAMFMTLFIVGWTIPHIMFFGLMFNVWYLMWILVPPVALGIYATKPIFGGKTLFEATNTMVEFMSEPKGWTDYNNNAMREETYYISDEIWISRRTDLKFLADVIEGKVTVQEVR